MRLLLATEAHFFQAEGRIWTAGPEDYGFWSSYLEVFDEVRVLARVARREAPHPGWRPSSGPGVCFDPMSDYRGPFAYLYCLPSLRAAALRAVASCDACLLRIPGAVGYLAADAVRRRGLPFGVEVLGDPWESLGSPFRHWSRRRLRTLCRDAAVSCYVTPVLLRRYPSRQPFCCADVRLRRAASDDDLRRRRTRALEAARGRRPWRLGFLGSMERLYKGPDVLFAALARLRAAGWPAILDLAGAGRLRPRLERLAGRLGLASAVRFLGPLPPGEPVERFLDSLDLFLLPSRTEGLPRALVEAMARGCPAIGSAVGGIPDLLPPENLVPPGRPEPLARKIAEMLSDPDRLALSTRRNAMVARDFLWERLAPRRREFLCRLQSCYI
jgi:glycosyltransferase involved in cell wall biosynthesis